MRESGGSMRLVFFCAAFFFLASAISPARAAGPMIVNAHLSSFDLESVKTAAGYGANMVEIDLWQLDMERLDPVLRFFSQEKGLRLVLHWKGNVLSELSQLTRVLQPYQAAWPRLFFYSSDEAFNQRVRQAYPGIYVTRSTRSQVWNCLTNGLVDERAFHADCLQADLWPPYDQLLGRSSGSRESTIALLRKIRAYERDNHTPPSLIAVDQVNSRDVLCDVLENLRDSVDGLITEKIELIGPYLRDPTTCGLLAH